MAATSDPGESVMGGGGGGGDGLLHDSLSYTLKFIFFLNSLELIDIICQ